ncbi:type II toxin-antitoxin system RelE/ParE family toxin [Dyadobacter luticola]|uniref:Type II toxin-antitoxin system RelE/ParE family toxin n=1 Tax=Dyadobacter luticola TaxID=1979387 RepID=A0A5R9L523_9BACT|nr:type II toxin-antitoxin system RelE/ParE family toxin [Dyadobacter luticola]TLV03663.1 type II toxin-antitoxin system RelE/ParE family toxin [Dyadobacter luticola]
MRKIREVVTYKHYFDEFMSLQTKKVRAKIFKTIEAVETLQHIPTKYLKHIHRTKGLYEARIGLGTDIWRVFCFFDNDRLVVLLTGFQKKTEKTPRNEIKKAVGLMNEYQSLK